MALVKNFLIALPAVLAVLVHVYIFVLETRLTSPTSMKAFGIRDAAEAELMRPWAYNQGWYNLLLGGQVFVGVILLFVAHSAGVALVAGGTCIMLAAALVLVTSDASKMRAGIVQGLFPALTIIAVLIDAL